MNINHVSDISFFKHPLFTIKFFYYEILYNLKLLNNHFHQFLGFIIFFLTTNILGFYIDEYYLFWIQFFNYSLLWFILGILSSIGLGAGLPTGILFLFPHIYNICKNYEKYGNIILWESIWFKPNDLVDFRESDLIYNKFSLNLFMRCWIVFFIWGIGTAFGELPPFLFSKMASISDSKINKLINKEKDNLLSNMQKWMMDFMKKYGALGVILMSSYPNIFFDLCGLCCGYLQMSTSKFLLSTIVGKSIIKTLFQNTIIIYCSLEIYQKYIIEFVEIYFPFFSKKLDLFLKNLDSIEGEVERNNGESSYIFYVWNLFSFFFIVVFLVSSIQKIAKKHYIDHYHLEKKK